MSINSMLPSIQDKYAENGNIRGIMLTQIIPSQVVVILVRGIPAFLAAFYGPTVIDGLLASVPAWGIAGFNTVGKVLPAVGVAMLLKYMARKDLLVFFGLGFAVSAYMGMNNLLFAAFIGAAMGYIYISLQPKEVQVNGGEEDEI